MNIAIDIDDTLTDSFGYFIPYVAEYFGADKDALSRANISYSTLPDEWRDREVAFGKAYYDRVVADTPFKPGAAEAVRALRAAGHRVVILTARTPDFYTDPYKTTAAELANGGIEYDKLICSQDKASACLAEGVSVLIDDMPANCEAVRACGVRAILFRSRGNREVKVDFPSVTSWEEAERLLLSMGEDVAQG